MKYLIIVLVLALSGCAILESFKKPVEHEEVRPVMALDE